MLDTLQHTPPHPNTEHWPWPRKPLPKSKGKAAKPMRVSKQPRSQHKKMLRAFSQY